MTKNLKQKFSPKLRKLAIVTFGIVMISSCTTASGIWYYKKPSFDPNTSSQEISSNKNKENDQTISDTHTDPETGKQNDKKQTKNDDKKTKQNNTAKTNTTTESPQNNQPTTPASTNNNTAQTTQTPQATTVSLSVNGSSKGSITLNNGSNHCNVLSSARAQGKISSLDMRYVAEFGSQGIYVIDGIGDSSAIWWTYTVNGRSPPSGCSHVTARNGDSVNWTYSK